MPILSIPYSKLLNAGYAVVAQTSVDAHCEGDLGFLALDAGKAEGYCDAVFDGLRTTLLGGGEEGMGCISQ